MPSNPDSPESADPDDAQDVEQAALARHEDAWVSHRDLMAEGGVDDGARTDPSDSAGPPIQDVTRKLIDTIGPTLVRAIVGLQDSALLEAWSSPGGPTPAPTEQRRVRNAHDQLDRITAVEGADVARAWLIGHNDRLGSTPITALREDRFRDVEAAVSALLET